MALAAIKYRAYPTPEQAEFFQRTFGCVRKIWNCLLADSNEYHKLKKKHHVNYESQYKSVYPYLKDVDSLALSNARLQLQTAYNRFFEKKSGFPKFKSKHKSKRSYTTNNQGRRIANQRLDNLHKISAMLARQYDIVCVEDLNMKSLSNKGFGNGKSTMDNGYGMFLVMLKYKLERKGGYLVKVSKWYPSSQLCSVCGKKHPEMKIVKRNPKQGYLVCDCGNRMQRDSNAAKNILSEGLRILTS